MKAATKLSLTDHPDFEIVNINNKNYYKLKEGIKDDVYTFKFVSDGETLTVSII